MPAPREPWTACCPDDNPYTEDRNAIIAEIAGALRTAGKIEGPDFAVIPDRRKAIAHAIGIAREGDTVSSPAKVTKPNSSPPKAPTPATTPNSRASCSVNSGERWKGEVAGWV